MNHRASSPVGLQRLLVSLLSLSAACASHTAQTRRPTVASVPRAAAQSASVPAPVAPSDAGTSSANPSATAPAEDDRGSSAVSFASLPGWSEDALAEVLPAWRRTCERIARGDETRAFGRDATLGTIADWRAPCQAIPDDGAEHAVVRAYFERWFAPVAVTSEEGEYGLFTGYYEPLLRGSRRRRGRYRVPLYGRPTDLVMGPSGPARRVRGRLRPYWTRAQIAAGVLRRRAQVIVWVDDAVEAFFLEIQGSGRVELDDGTMLQLNYAGSNGHRYVALGRVLIDRGALERSAVSLQSIRAWLHAHPRQAQSMMNENPSYVFFRESPVVGAHGAEGVVLTPGRSMAVDPRFVPLGVPLFVDAAPLEGVGPIRRLVIAQDTGGAIRGAVRGDLFWGFGQEAYDRAGRMRQRGRYWMLVPKTIASRRA